MYSTSPEFKATVRESHRATVRAEVYRSGVFLRSLDILDGQVDIDARRSQRRTCSVRVAATRPTVEYVPVYNRYASIKGALVTWETATSTWELAGSFTWDDANNIPSNAIPSEFNTYAELSAGFPNYGSLQQIVAYDPVTVDDGLIPTSALSDLAPFGNELYLWRGIDVPDKPQFYTYGKIKGLIVTWDLVSASVNWATVDSGITWDSANNIPVG